MFETLRNALKVKDIRKRLLFTLVVLIICRLGSQLPIPGIDTDTISQYLNSLLGDSFNLLNSFTGGSFESMALYALTVTPYITASIIIQLLTMAIPALEELYPDDKEEQIKGLKRHMQFFITENMIGGIIPGIITSLEEQRAIQKRDQVPEDQLISEDLINSVKNGMMGPFAGVGDTLNYATLKPLISTFFMGFAQQGMLWAPIVDDILLYVILVSEGKFMFNMGYKLGTDSAMNILQNNAVQKIVTFFSIVGLFVMGTMAAQNVNVAVIYEIPYGAKDMISIQELLFNPIAPGILSLLAVFGVYAYLKKGGTVLKVTLVLLVIAIALGGLGILGV